MKYFLLILCLFANSIAHAKENGFYYLFNMNATTYVQKVVPGMSLNLGYRYGPHIFSIYNHGGINYIKALGFEYNHQFKIKNEIDGFTITAINPFWNHFALYSKSDKGASVRALRSHYHGNSFIDIGLGIKKQTGKNSAINLTARFGLAKGQRLRTDGIISPFTLGFGICRWR